MTDGGHRAGVCRNERTGDSSSAHYAIRVHSGELGAYYNNSWTCSEQLNPRLRRSPRGLGGCQSVLICAHCCIAPWEHPQELGNHPPGCEFYIDKLGKKLRAGSGACDDKAFTSGTDWAWAV